MFGTTDSVELKSLLPPGLGEHSRARVSITITPERIAISLADHTAEAADGSLHVPAELRGAAAASAEATFVREPPPEAPCGGAAAVVACTSATTGSCGAKAAMAGRCAPAAAGSPFARTSAAGGLRA